MRAALRAASASSCALDALQGRQQFVGDERVAERADVFPADRAVGVDEECFRRTVDAPVDRGLAFEVGDHQPVRIAELVEPARSEEHTSELQSQSNLVCRLLLEKKKTVYRKNVHW